MPVSPIRSINELLKELLRHRTAEAYGPILERYDVPTRDLEPYFRWNARHYTRTCIHRNDDFELLVVCYESGQRTSIHDYDSQTAWVHPVMGAVVEEVFEPAPQGGLRIISEKLLVPGSVDVLKNGHAIHRFINPGPERAVTLNLYAKPMSKWRVYDERTGSASISPAGPPR